MKNKKQRDYISKVEGADKMARPTANSFTSTLDSFMWHLIMI